MRVAPHENAVVQFTMFTLTPSGIEVLQVNSCVIYFLHLLTILVYDISTVGG